MSVSELYGASIRSMPLIGILRGITPDEAVDVVQRLYDAGFRVVEVPLNSPTPLRTLERLNDTFGDRMLIGAGTVLRQSEVDDVVDAGGSLIVSPNVSPEVIHRAIDRGAFPIPGAATPTEAFFAMSVGATAVKLFPAEQLAPKVLKAWRAVVPNEIHLLPVGGIGTDNMAGYWNAGASGFGIGGALYTSGKSSDDIHASALALVAAASRLSHTVA